MLKLVSPIHGSKNLVIDAKRPFDKSTRIENMYANSLLDLSNEVDDILDSYDGENIDDLLSSLMNYSNDLFDWATSVVTKIVYNLDTQDKAMWQRHAKEMSRALKYEINNAPIDALMARYTKENVGLIKSVPVETARRIQRLVLENLQSGRHRATGLAKEIQKIKSMNKNRAMLIARTEVSRMSTGLTKVRSEELGIAWYVWRSSHDVRVRTSHGQMDNVIVRWDDPPNPERLFHGGKGVGKPYGYYHAGETFNCRCYPQPIIRVDDVKFPCKMHQHGMIVNVTRNQFLKMSEGEIPMKVNYGG